MLFTNHIPFSNAKLAANENKALGFLSKGIELQSQGRTQEADKNFLQAYVLSPQNPIITNRAAEFLESFPERFPLVCY